MWSPRRADRIVLLCAVLLAQARAAYFHVHEGEEKCFVETVPAQQVLTVQYRHRDNPGVACMIIFKDPRNTQVFSKRVGPDEKETSKAAYMAQKKGDHKVCVQCQGSKWFQTTALKWELKVDMGDTEFSKNPATRGDLRSVERTALSTLARVEAIAAENDYEKAAEMDFRNVSESMNSHVIWVAVFIIVLEGGLAAWQVSHLLAFFGKEKLI
eukprot:TRINITY_DN59724_c0_g1_i1.p1 TRINITY_DN59724_c0_g1~~TRINITY_DN59724_c0_g1_i1.p1  ORF type:complete len:212 (+),score=66.11 TRINITY_DN59724_c0_g1_i1:100-735(+)